MPTVQIVHQNEVSSDPKDLLVSVGDGKTLTPDRLCQIIDLVPDNHGISRVDIDQ